MERLINEHVGLFVVDAKHHFAFMVDTEQAAISEPQEKDEQSQRGVDNRVYMRAEEAALAHEVLEGEELVAAFAALRERLPREQMSRWLVPQRFYAGDDLGRLAAELDRLAPELADRSPAMQRVIAAARSMLDRARACNGCFFWALGYDWEEEEVLDEAAQAARDAEIEEMHARFDAFVERMDEEWASGGWSRAEIIGGVVLCLMDPAGYAAVHDARARALDLHGQERDDEGLELSEQALHQAQRDAIKQVELHKLAEIAALEQLAEMLGEDLPDIYQDTGAYSREQARALQKALSRWETDTGGEARAIEQLMDNRRGHDRTAVRRAYRTFKKTLSRAAKGGHAFVWLFDYTD